MFNRVRLREYKSIFLKMAAFEAAIAITIPASYSFGSATASVLGCGFFGKLVNQNGIDDNFRRNKCTALIGSLFSLTLGFIRVGINFPELKLYLMIQTSIYLTISILSHFLENRLEFYPHF